MENYNYTTKLKFYAKAGIYIFPIILVALIVVILTSSDPNDNRLVLYGVIAISIVNYIQFLKRPIEMQVFNDKLNLKNVLSKDNFVYFKNIKSIEINFMKILTIKTDDKPIKLSAAFPELKKVIKDIQKVNETMTVKGINLD